MKIVVFGPTGMVGQGAVREALLDPAVDTVVTVARSQMAVTNPKQQHVLHTDFGDLSPIAAQL
ncbi:MAG: hypothetical protein QOF58_7207, partial [Pseudonocardiales bacterium]|nr:hypothetical protein [Pseudonocardiales bacterium]